MKIKKFLFGILFLVNLILLIISHILFYSGAYDSLEDRDFVGEFNTLASKTNFTDGQKEKIIKELTNKMSWKEPGENLDGLLINSLLIIFTIPVFLHIIFFLFLVVYKIKFKNIILLITFNLFSLISLILPIYYSFAFLIDIAKPINLTEKDYTTNNIEFNKLIKDKISDLNWRTSEYVMSFVLILLSLIITITVLVIIIIEKKKEKIDNNIEISETPILN